MERPSQPDAAPAGVGGLSPAAGWRPPRSRRWLHLVLLLGTCLTLCLAGGLVWDPGDAPLESPGDLLRPERLAGLLAAGGWYALWTLAILGAHEMGHYTACRLHGIPATLPFFLPGVPPLGTFGAVIRIRGRIPDRRALFDVAAAGPIAGFAVAVPVLVFGLLRAEPIEILPGGPDSAAGARLGEPFLLSLLQRALVEPGDLAVNGWIGAGWVGLLVTSLNLFPVGQLDGGHAVYALSRRAHRVVARATLAALLVVVVVQSVAFAQFPFYLVWFAILLWMRDRHPRLLDESHRLGAPRTIVAVLLGLIFALSFIFVPLRVD